MGAATRFVRFDRVRRTGEDALREVDPPVETVVQVTHDGRFVKLEHETGGCKFREWVRTTKVEKVY